MNSTCTTRNIAIFTLVALLTLGLICRPAQSAVPVLSAASQSALNQALIDAAAQGQLDTVSLDVYRGADVNATDRYKRSPLTACAGGEGPESTRLEIIKLLVGLGADVNQHSVFQPTPLLIAIDYRQKLIAHYLLSSGADPETFDALGECALTHTARTGQLDLLNALLAKGADVRATDHKGRTPLMWSSGKPAAIADVTSLDEVTPSERGFTVIRCVHNRIADQPGGGDIVRALLAANSQIDAVDNEGNTALMVAAGEGKTEVARALIDAHADWRRRNDQSDTALMCAELGGYHDTVAYLKTIGGGKDPIYLALEKRVEGAKTAHDRAIESICGRDTATPQSNVPGLSLRVYAESEFVGDGNSPRLHYMLENHTNAPISVMSVTDLNHDSPSPAKAGWSIAQIDKNRGAHPAQPDFPVLSPNGGTIAALSTIGIVTVPANGHVELPISQSLSPVADQSTATAGVYRAAFYYISDPQNLPYATNEVHAAANATAACRLVSNEITIINE